MNWKQVLSSSIVLLLSLNAIYKWVGPETTIAIVAFLTSVGLYNVSSSKKIVAEKENPKKEPT